ncbi:hypothetical protein ACA910_016335 [Epithemia clementina (nom. ined.)]
MTVSTTRLSTWSKFCFILLSLTKYKVLANVDPFLTSPENGDFICQVGLLDLWESETETEQDGPLLQCSPVDQDDGSISMFRYDLDLPSDLAEILIESFSPDNDLFVAIPGGYISGPAIVVPDPSSVYITGYGQEVDGDTTRLRRTRSLAPAKGRLAVLLVLVEETFNGLTSGITASKFNELVFTKTLSLKNQYYSCSRQQLELYNYLTENGDSTPAITVKVNVDSITQHRNIVQNEAMIEVLKYLKTRNPSARTITDVVDLVIYSVPLQSKWSAFAYIGKETSVFGGHFLNYLVIQMHEVAHCFGLKHSHKKNAAGKYVAYLDKSGVMGGATAAIYTSNGPQECFNAANFGALGWNSDLTAIVNPNKISSVKLIGFPNHASAATDQSVQVNTKLDSNRNYWMIFNQVTSYNVGTQEHGNTLTITHLQTSGAQAGTHFITALDTSRAGSFYEENLGTSKFWRVEICQINQSTSRSPMELVVYMGFTTRTGISLCQQQAAATSSFAAADMETLQDSSPPISWAPTTEPPTRSPTPRPTNASTSGEPTTKSSTESPTPSPTTVSSSGAPTTKSSTGSLSPSPTTPSPSGAPTTEAPRPTASPTDSPTVGSLAATNDPTAIPSSLSSSFSDAPSRSLLPSFSYTLSDGPSLSISPSTNPTLAPEEQVRNDRTLLLITDTVTTSQTEPQHVASSSDHNDDNKGEFPILRRRAFR